jgi:hypothetical protein
MLREALGELKGLKEEFQKLGDRLTDRFAEERAEVWEEEWNMEDDELWVSRESTELSAEKSGVPQICEEARGDVH